MNSVAIAPAHLERSWPCCSQNVVLHKTVRFNSRKLLHFVGRQYQRPCLRISMTRRWLKCLPTMSYAMDASVSQPPEDEIPDWSRPAPVFSRLHIRDPYKLLGISRDASEFEIQEARSFLMDEYGRHERSREAIEAAHDKIIFESFRQRKRTKINLKSNLKKKLDDSPPWVKRLAYMVEVPDKTTIMRRAALFALLGVWSITNAVEGGPAFQVAVALGTCIFFTNDRLKSVSRACVLGFGALAVGWLLGSFTVPLFPIQLLPKTWSLELLTALISYVFLWFACTFLK